MDLISVAADLNRQWTPTWGVSPPRWGFIMSEAESIPIIGLDIAKNVFQVHQVDSETGEIRRRQI